MVVTVVAAPVVVVAGVMVATVVVVVTAAGLPAAVVAAPRMPVAGRRPQVHQRVVARAWVVRAPLVARRAAAPVVLAVAAVVVAAPAAGRPAPSADPGADGWLLTTSALKGNASKPPQGGFFVRLV